MKYVTICALLVLAVDVCRSSEERTYTISDLQPTSSSGTIENRLRTYRYSDACTLESALPYKRENIRMKCCDYVTKQFSKFWTRNEYYLSTYLETLQTWNCSQFGIECTERPYSFTPFSSMMYMRFCNHSELRKRCWDTLSSLHLPGNNLDATREIVLHVRSPEEKKEMISATAMLHMTVDDETFTDPCIQVFMYDYDGGYGYYHEIKNMFLPFCGFVWCGMHSDALDKETISDWSCMPDRCKRNAVIMLIVVGTLSILIMLSNLFVVVIFKSSASYSSSQTRFKISLAIADFIVGAVVTPTIIVTFCMLVFSKHSMGKEISNSYYHQQKIRSVYYNITTRPPHGPGGRFEEKISQNYLDVIGIFTTVSICASVDTILLAAFDRFYALSRPLRYAVVNTKRVAVIAIITAWISVGLVSVLPLFVDSLKYSLVASYLVASLGSGAIILYTLAFALPLILQWITSISLFIIIRRHSRNTRSLRITRSHFNLEARLARTLILMIGVFTLCYLPPVIVLVSSLLIDNISFNNPSRLSESAASAYISFEFICLMVLLSNSLWNCFIYNARNQEFRDQAKVVLANLLQNLPFYASLRSLQTYGASTDAPSDSFARRSTFQTNSYMTTNKRQLHAFNNNSEEVFQKNYTPDASTAAPSGRMYFEKTKFNDNS